MTSPFLTRLRPLLAANGGVQPSAKLLGIHRQTIHAWLRGLCEPSEPMQRGVLAMLEQAAKAAEPEKKG